VNEMGGRRETHHDTQIRMTDPRMGNVHQNLPRAGGGHVEFDDFGRDGARGIVDQGLVLFGEFGRRHPVDFSSGDRLEEIRVGLVHLDRGQGMNLV
jgi:hypothetical protein